MYSRPRLDAGGEGDGRPRDLAVVGVAGAARRRSPRSGHWWLMPVMSGEPSAAATIWKLTVVVVPVPNTSPLQPPGPAMSASAPGHHPGPLGAVTGLYPHLAGGGVVHERHPVRVHLRRRQTVGRVDGDAGQRAAGRGRTRRPSAAPRTAGSVVVLSAATTGASVVGGAVVSVGSWCRSAPTPAPPAARGTTAHQHRAHRERTGSPPVQCLISSLLEVLARR